MYVNTVAKAYIWKYMWTAANFIIEGRMRPYGRRLCTVGLDVNDTWKSFIANRKMHFCQ